MKRRWGGVEGVGMVLGKSWELLGMRVCLRFWITES